MVIQVTPGLRYDIFNILLKLLQSYITGGLAECYKHYNISHNFTL